MEPNTWKAHPVALASAGRPCNAGLGIVHPPEIPQVLSDKKGCSHGKRLRPSLMWPHRFLSFWNRLIPKRFMTMGLFLKHRECYHLTAASRHCPGPPAGEGRWARPLRLPRCRFPFDPGGRAPDSVEQWRPSSFLRRRMECLRPGA